MGVLIHWDVDGVWSSTSISVPVLAGGGFPGFPRAGILIVSFSFAWLCINFAVCSCCSDLVGLLARSNVMLALDSLMSPVDRSLSCGDSVSFPLPFSFSCGSVLGVGSGCGLSCSSCVFLLFCVVWV